MLGLIRRLWTRLTNRGDAASLLRDENSGAAAVLLADKTRPPLPERPAGNLFWFHQSTVIGADTMSELCLVLDDVAGGGSLLLTGPNLETIDTGRKGPLAIRQPTPAGGFAAARVFLDHWRPDAALFFSSDLPPSAIVDARATNTLLALYCDGKPDRLPRNLIKKFDRVFARDEADAAMLHKLGVEEARIIVVGEMAHSPAPPACREIAREELARILSSRPCWLAADTTATEDSVVVSAHSRASRYSHRLLLILKPNDPARGVGLAENLRSEGWRVALRSADELPEEETQIYIADVAQEDGLWYRVAPLCFLGNTLEPDGGVSPDPVAPAGLGSAILHGPKYGAYADFYTSLHEEQAARLVRDDEGLGRVVNALIAPDKAAKLAHNAWIVSTRGAEAISLLATELVAAMDAQVGAE